MRFIFFQVPAIQARLACAIQTFIILVVKSSTTFFASIYCFLNFFIYNLSAIALASR